MYKILAALLPFIRELFFNRKEEMDFNSYRFNAKKWIIYLVFLFTIVYSITISHRLFSLNGKFIEITRRFHKLEVAEKNDLDMIDTLRSKNENLQDENTKLMQKCIKDSRVIDNRPQYVLRAPPKVKNSTTSK